MDTLRQVNHFVTILFRFVVGILLLVIFYKSLMSVLIKPEWGIVASLVLITLLFAGYGLGFGQQLEKWFDLKTHERHLPNKE